MLDGLSMLILKSSRIMTGSDGDTDGKPGTSILSESADVLFKVSSDCREEGYWVVQLLACVSKEVLEEKIKAVWKQQ